jgi:hypothetical protein
MLNALYRLLEQVGEKVCILHWPFAMSRLHKHADGFCCTFSSKNYRQAY